MPQRIALCCHRIAETHFAPGARGLKVKPQHQRDAVRAIVDLLHQKRDGFIARPGMVAGQYLILPPAFGGWCNSGIAVASSDPADYLARTDYDGQVRAFLRREVAERPERQVPDRNVAMWVVRADTALDDPDSQADPTLVERTQTLLARARRDDAELYEMVILLDHPGPFSPFDPIRLAANLGGHTGEMTNAALARLTPEARLEKLEGYRRMAVEGYAYWQKVNWVADPDCGVADFIRAPAVGRRDPMSYWVEA